MCFRVLHLCSKIPKINNCTGEFATVIWRLTVSQSCSVVASAENPAPDNSPQSIGELRNHAMARGQFTRTLLYQTG